MRLLLEEPRDGGLTLRQQLRISPSRGGIPPPRFLLRTSPRGPAPHRARSPGSATGYSGPPHLHPPPPPPPHPPRASPHSPTGSSGEHGRPIKEPRRLPAHVPAVFGTTSAKSCRRRVGVGGGTRRVQRVARVEGEARSKAREKRRNRQTRSDVT